MYGRWLTLYRSFPKVERFGVGQKLEAAFLDTLEYVFVLSYMPPVEKFPMLGKAISRLDTAKFFLQITWENKLLNDEQYLDLMTGLEEVGKMLFGWRKGLEGKTPAR